MIKKRVNRSEQRMLTDQKTRKNTKQNRECFVNEVQQCLLPGGDWVPPTLGDFQELQEENTEHRKNTNAGRHTLFFSAHSHTGERKK